MLEKELKSRKVLRIGKQRSGDLVVGGKESRVQCKTLNWRCVLENGKCFDEESTRCSGIPRESAESTSGYRP